MSNIFLKIRKKRCLPASTLEPEEREFVDSGASMHLIRKKDLSDAEMDILTKSFSPTIVTTANGEVQTHEKTIVNVKELDIFLTMKVLENTSAVLSLEKFCDENEYFYEWINGQKPHLIKDGIRIICNTESYCGSRLVKCVMLLCCCVVVVVVVVLCCVVVVWWCGGVVVCWCGGVELPKDLP